MHRMSKSQKFEKVNLKNSSGLLADVLVLDSTLTMLLVRKSRQGIPSPNQVLMEKYNLLMK